MAFVVRAVHIVALGLWLGGVTFFSFFTALPIIDHMRELASQPDNWIGLESERDGTRLAGEALSAVFAHYFHYQVGCGVVALASALTWVRQPGRIHKVRVLAIAAALVLAAANLFFFEPVVNDLRTARYSNDEARRQEADRSFATWHNVSLVADMAGLAMILLAAIAAAALPHSRQRETAAT